MRKPSKFAALVVAVLSLTAVALQGTGTSAAQQSPHLRIDTIVADNAADALGPINETAQKRVGETFDVDVVVQSARDLLGFGFDFTYDPLVVHATRVNVHMLLASEPGSNVADFTKNFAPPEDSDGILTPVAADLAQGTAGSSEGEGVLVRLRLEAVGCGASRLTVRPNSILGPMLQDSRGELFNPVSVEDAEILVTSAEGEQCPKPATASESPGANQPSTVTPSASLAANDGEGGDGDAAVEGDGELRPDTEDSGVLSDQAELQTGESSAASDDTSEDPTSRLTPGTDLTDSPEVSPGDSGHTVLWWLLIFATPTAAAVSLAIVAARFLLKRPK